MDPQYAEPAPVYDSYGEYQEGAVVYDYGGAAVQASAQDYQTQVPAQYYFPQDHRPNLYLEDYGGSQGRFLEDPTTPDTFPYTISPASSSLTDDGSSSSCGAFLDYAEGGLGGQRIAGGKLRKRRSPEVQQRQRRAANERERRRMQSINGAFDELRTRIPTLPYEKKLSKVDTLRLAIGYIHMLNDMVQQSEEDGRGGAEGLGGRGGRGAAHGGRFPPPPKKVVVDCHATDFGNEEEKGLVVRGHSLSWNPPVPSHRTATLSAKVWVPSFSPPPPADDPSSQLSPSAPLAS